MEELLKKDDRTWVLGGDDLTYVDLHLACFGALWVLPPSYGGPQTVLNLDMASWPHDLAETCKRWRADYPRVAAFVQRVYSNERCPATSDGSVIADR
ncbi:unnamed protein product [Discosporangium mesarthrocarpum]